MSFQYSKDLLPSGLTVVTLSTPHLHTASVVAYVRTGSRHEDARTNGVSHFLEHMFFRGSDGYPDTVKMNAAVEEVGGNLNGVTGRDYGCYFTPLHPQHLDVGVRVLGDLLTRPRLVEIETERHVILEEMLDEVDEKGRDVDLDNLAKRQLYGTHPLGLKIAGTPESVRGITDGDLRTHLARHYVAGNIVFVAAGKVERRHVRELVSEAFDGVPKGSRASEAPPPRVPMGPQRQYVEHAEPQTSFRASFVSVPDHHPDAPALALLRRVLDDGLSSRLPFHVVERRGLAYSIYASIETFDDAGVFEVGASSAPENAGAVFEETCRVLSELCDRGPTAEELARGQRRTRISLDFVQDSPGDLAGHFGATELFRAPEPFEVKLERTERVTLADVRKVARRYLNLKNLHVVAVGPRKGRKAFERAVDQAKLGR